jgi:CubicO group peptidase (beta-lactamase class C family)
MLKILYILTFPFLVISAVADQLLFEKKSLITYQKSLIDDGVTGSNAALVYQNGKKIYHEFVQSGKDGDKDINEDTIFPIWSMTKPVTIVAMMKLHEQEKFEFEDPLSKYIPAFKELSYKEGGKIKKCKQPLKIIHLLTHTSGYKYYDDEPLPVKIPNYESIHPNQTQFNDLATYVDAVAKHPLEFEPGTKYQYGINQAILGRVIEVISGKDFEVFLKENIFNPLNMVNTGFSMTKDERKRFQPLWIKSDYLKGFTYLLDEMTYSLKSKAHFGGEGLVSTMNDYSNFCEMLVNGGAFKGKQIISKKSIKTMKKKWADWPTETGLFAKMKGYHNGFSIFVLNNPKKDNPDTPEDIWGWAGYHNTHFWIDEKNKVYGLFMSRAREFDWDIPLGMRKVVYGK